MALLQPDTARIGHPTGQPAEDRVSDERVFGTPRELREALSKLIGGDQVLHRAIDLIRYASDASPYRLIPQVVVTPRTTGDVVALLKYLADFAALVQPVEAREAIGLQDAAIILQMA